MSLLSELRPKKGPHTQSVEWAEAPPRAGEEQQARGHKGQKATRQEPLFVADLREGRLPCKFALPKFGFTNRSV